MAKVIFKKDLFDQVLKGRNISKKGYVNYLITEGEKKFPGGLGYEPQSIKNAMHKQEMPEDVFIKICQLLDVSPDLLTGKRVEYYDDGSLYITPYSVYIGFQLSQNNDAAFISWLRSIPGYLDPFNDLGIPPEDVWQHILEHTNSAWFEIWQEYLIQQLFGFIAEHNPKPAPGMVFTYYDKETGTMKKRFGNEQK